MLRKLAARIGHFSINLSLVLRVGVLHYISFICKLNSFSSEWLCTKPRFDEETYVRTSDKLPSTGMVVTGGPAEIFLSQHVSCSLAITG